MGILDIGLDDEDLLVNDSRSPAPRKNFLVALELFCDNCKTHVVVKISNVSGPRGFSINEGLAGLAHRVYGPNDKLS